MRYCGMCGTSLAQICLNCGAANPLVFNYCGMCGLPLPEEKTRVAQPTLPGFFTPYKRRTAVPIEEEPAEPPIPTQIDLKGERRVVTVILADVTSSTNLLENLGTEKWVVIMNRVLHILESEVYRYGGTVDQFRGDGLVAFFGATEAHEDDPERAVLAGLSMQQAFARYSEELARGDGIELMIRVGINTGEVIVASVGNVRQHREDTAMGIGVAIAARMETAAEPGTVLVCENTYRLIKEHFEWLPMGDITVKGISRPLACYRPLTPKTVGERRHALEFFGSSLPLIGRETEFDVLVNSMKDLSEGRGHIVLLSGEAGMGKTFLLNEVQQHYARQVALAQDTQGINLLEGKFLNLQGRCRSYERSRPYSMWLDLLRAWLNTRSGDAPEDIRTRLHNQCIEIWGDKIGDYYPYLATLLSLPLEEEFTGRVKHLNAEGLRQQFFICIKSWIEMVSRRGPLIVTFTEMQWADTSSLELLKSCLPLAESKALLWLLIFRPDRVSPIWDLRHYIETHYPHRLKMLELLPLTQSQSEELISALIGDDILLPETCHLIVKNSEGNPYFIIELIHSLIDSEILIQDEITGKWQTQSTTSSLELPDSLQRLLIARIDRLSPDERHVLQMASVIGNAFWFNVLHELVGETVPLIEHLTALQRSQLILERGRIPDLGMEYSFKSTLVREAAYESLLSPHRSSLHLSVAEYFEEFVDVENRKQHEGLIAYHYRHAGNPNKEFFYTLRAAEEAREVYANTEAIGHYSRALEILEEMEINLIDQNQRYAIISQRFEVLQWRSTLYFFTGELDKSVTDAHALLALAEMMPDDPAWKIDALLHQPSVRFHNTREEIYEGLDLADQALELAKKTGDKRRELTSLIALGDLYNIIRDHRWRDLAERALVLARELGDISMEVNLLLGIGSAYGLDDLQQSTHYLEAALPLLKQLDDKRAELRLMIALGDQSERAGDYYRYLTEYIQNHLAISREIGDRIEEGSALMFSGQVQGIYLGDYEAGLAIEQEAAQLLENLTSMIYPLLRIIQLQVLMGRYDEALANLEIARPIGMQAVNDICRAGMALVSAMLYIALGDEVHLRKVFDYIDIVELLVSTQLVSRQYQIAASCEASVAFLKLAKLVANQEESQSFLAQALKASQAALDIYREFGFIQIIECTSEEILYRHYLTLEANGLTEEARKYLRQAYDEMMRKCKLIPANSPYRKSFLENIQLHREIRSAYTLAKRNRRRNS